MHRILRMLFVLVYAPQLLLVNALQAGCCCSCRLRPVAMSRFYPKDRFTAPANYDGRRPSHGDIRRSFQALADAQADGDAARAELKRFAAAQAAAERFEDRRHSQTPRSRPRRSSRQSSGGHSVQSRDRTNLRGPTGGRTRSRVTPTPGLRPAAGSPPRQSQRPVRPMRPVPKRERSRPVRPSAADSNRVPIGPPAWQKRPQAILDTDEVCEHPWPFLY